MNTNATNTNNVAVVNSVEEEERTQIATVSIDQVVFNGFKTTINQYTCNIVRALSEVYAFDYDDAMARLCLDMELSNNNTSHANKRKKAVDASGDGATAETSSKKKKTKTDKNGPTIPLPWCGVAMPDWCQSIRNNHGLYTQCANLKQTEGQLCVSCSNEMAKASNGALKYGLVNDRPEVFNKQTPYVKIMAKHKITKETAQQEAEKFGWVIPESAFDEKANGSPRGRPKKVSSQANSSDEASSPAKRGRPAKTKPVESASAENDVIGQMIHEITHLTSEVQLEDTATNKTKTKKAKKNAETVETSSVESTEESPKKKRVISDETKAKMAAKRAEKATEKATIKAAEAKAEQEKIRKQMVQEQELEIEDEEELELTAFAYKGTQYGRDDKNNNVYTLPTEDEEEPTLIGVWDKKTKSISFNKDEESELEEEEHDD